MARKSEPFTMRLTRETDLWVEEEARRTRRSKGAVVEALAEEAARMRRFPGIAFRGPEHDRRAWIIGTALDVWQVIEAYEDMGMERLLEEGDLSERFVRLALAYHKEYLKEIDEAIALNRRSQEEWHALYPFLVPAPEEE
jgi:hypothetical protein